MEVVINTELDPVFHKALCYLHFKNKDSAETLKTLLDESLCKGIDSSYRPPQKIKVELNDPVEIPKRPRQEKPEARSSPITEQFSKDLPLPDLSSFDETSADDFAMEMGLACMVCRQMTVFSGNQLVECQECHNLYHQDCHKPQVTDKDVNDPRLVWYCARCSRQMKRMVSAAVSSNSSNVGISSSSVSGLTGWAAFGAKTASAVPVTAKLSATAQAITEKPPTLSAGQKPVAVSGLVSAKPASVSKTASGNSSTIAIPLKPLPPLILGKTGLSRSMSSDNVSKVGLPSPSTPSGSGANINIQLSSSNGGGSNAGSSGNSSSKVAAEQSGAKGPTSQESQLNAMKRLQMVKENAAQKKRKK